MFARLRTPVLKNTGSVARDHLASERTFLAWLRTGLGFVALGIAVERFAQLDLEGVLRQLQAPSHQQSTSSTPSTPLKPAEDDWEVGHDALVGALLGTGGGSIAYGTARYFSNMRLLEQGLFKPAYYGAGMLGIAVAGLAGGVYVMRGRSGTTDDGR